MPASSSRVEPIPRDAGELEHVAERVAMLTPRRGGEVRERFGHRRNTNRCFENAVNMVFASSDRQPGKPLSDKGFSLLQA